MADAGLTQEPTFEAYVERLRRGLVGRFFQTAAQLAGLFWSCLNCCSAAPWF
jgi:hypothetical protein